MTAAIITSRHAEAIRAAEAPYVHVDDAEARRMDAEYNARMAEADARRACGEHVQERLNEIAADRSIPVVGVGAALTLAAILVYALVTI